MKSFWSPKKSVLLTRICVLLFLVIAAAMTAAGPWETHWFIDIYGYHQVFDLVFGKVGSAPGAGRPAASALLLILGYLSAASLIYMFLLMLRFLRAVSLDAIFTRENVRILRRISWCCAAGAGTTFLVGVLYARHFFAVTCAALFMMLVVRVIKNAFEQAVLMKDELDLTV